jgi:dihydrofolate synthase/folylpolyglutamate synthase
VSAVPRDFAAVQAGILSRAPEHTPNPSLERTATVCDLLGDPQRGYPVVHLTGTNGKTSIARMIDRILREHGLRTGRFTSPHLAHAGERIVIDGVRLSAERFVDVWEDVAPYIAVTDDRSREAGGPPLSFFEVLTCMAFAAFADAPVDVAVVEVGLGGRWDSTNVADGTVAVVSTVALDHERWLGHTVTEIAEQKAGIIKPGARVVLGEQAPDALSVLLSRCAEVGATALRQGMDFEVVERRLAVGGQRLALRSRSATVDDVYLPLHGAHQAGNAACAMAAAEALLVGDSGRSLDADLVRDAFAQVDSPGRLEVVARRPLVVVDAAHNPTGAAALAAALAEAFPGARFTAVLGVMADKDADGIAAALAPAMHRVIVTESSSSRAMPADELADAVDRAAGDRPAIVEPDLQAALATARDLAVDGDSADPAPGAMAGGVVVAGSVYLVAEARGLLGAPQPDTVAVDTTRRSVPAEPGGRGMDDDEGYQPDDGYASDDGSAESAGGDVG